MHRKAWSCGIQAPPTQEAWNMNEQQRAQWAALRANGKWRYMLVVGGVWGIFMTVLTPVVRYILFDQALSVFRVVIGLPIWMLGGLFVGWAMWSLSERTYNRHEE